MALDFREAERPVVYETNETTDGITAVVIFSVPVENQFSVVLIDEDAGAVIIGKES